VTESNLWLASRNRMIPSGKTSTGRLSRRYCRLKRRALSTNVYDDDNKPVWPTWTVGAFFRVRNVFTSFAYEFTILYASIYYLCIYVSSLGRQPSQQPKPTPNGRTGTHFSVENARPFPIPAKYPSPPKDVPGYAMSTFSIVLCLITLLFSQNQIYIVFFY
jgi:hypothetical protein